MKYPRYRPDAVCPKCAFSFIQMFRRFNDGAHDIIVDKDVKKCKVKGEHLHLECCCGYELVVRPLDWGAYRAKNEEVILKELQVIQGGVLQFDIYYTEQKKWTRFFVEPSDFFSRLGISMQNNCAEFDKKYLVDKFMPAKDDNNN